MTERILFSLIILLQQSLCCLSDFLLTLVLNKSVCEREKDGSAGASALRKPRKAKKNTYYNKKYLVKSKPWNWQLHRSVFQSKVKQNIRTELSVSPSMLSFQLVSSAATQEAQECECVSQYVVYLVNLSKSALNSYLRAQHWSTWPRRLPGLIEKEQLRPLWINCRNQYLQNATL